MLTLFSRLFPRPYGTATNSRENRGQPRGQCSVPCKSETKNPAYL